MKLLTSLFFLLSMSFQLLSAQSPATDESKSINSPTAKEIKEKVKKGITEKKGASNASVAELEKKATTVSKGDTKVRLLILFAGEKIADAKIEIGYKGKIIGNGITDNNGYVDIYTNDLISPNIDVYGIRNDVKWSIEDLLTLDENNYVEVDQIIVIEDFDHFMNQE